MLHIKILDSAKKQEINAHKAALRMAVKEALKPAHAGDLTLVICGDEDIRRLNHQFLGIDAPTDVLAFPASTTDPHSGIAYLGDVLVSYERAIEQAAARGITVQDEMQLLVVHGVLHLLGYDHDTGEAKSRMWAQQREVLQRLGCSIDEP